MDIRGSEGDVPYTETSTFSRLLSVPARVKMLDVFLGKHYTELTINDVADLADIHPTTVHRNIDALLNAEIIITTGKVGNAVQYQLNKENRIAKILGEARDRLIGEGEHIARTQQFHSRQFASFGGTSIQERLPELVNEEDAQRDVDRDHDSSMPGFDDLPEEVSRATARART